ncbi:MAG: nuclear transport factor 2 family protein [Chloroflexota bacterium]|nr:nuclear transport factor 2 family protein [Chloroflexota bacterium]
MSRNDQRKIAGVIETEKRWAAAHLDLDMDTIEAILSDEFMQIEADGSVIGKDELLISYRSGDRGWEIAQSDEYEVRLMGDVAILTGRWRGKGQNAGESFDYTARFMAVYRLEEDVWKQVAAVSVPPGG